MMLSFNCNRSHWEVKIVFLNFQNARTDNLIQQNVFEVPVKEFMFLLKK